MQRQLFHWREVSNTGNKIKVGFALCGSYCTFSKALEQMKTLKEYGFDIVPIMSENAFSTDTRFGKASDFSAIAEKISGRNVIHSISEAEPIGPKKMLDILIIEPCTGNTAAKLANGISDSAVTLAAKAHLRNGKPVLIGIATNDAFANSAANIGRLLNYRNIYFIPFGQDSSTGKPRSAICDFSLTLNAALAALKGEQLQPIISYIG